MAKKKARKTSDRQKQANQPLMLGSKAGNAALIKAFLKQGGTLPPKPGAPAAAKPAPGPPAAPTLVAPYLTADDLMNINAFTTDLGTKLAGIDADLGNLQTTTQYNETVNNKNAKQETSDAADSMAARGLFRSSIKDAALYDIEADRALKNKFLDDQLQTGITNAGTQKQILNQSKTRFDTAVAAKKVENAQGVNDPALASWADMMSHYRAPAAAPQSHAPGPAAPANPATKARTVTATAQTAANAVAARQRAQNAAAPKPPKPKVIKPKKPKGFAAYGKTPASRTGFYG